MNSVRNLLTIVFLGVFVVNSFAVKKTNSQENEKPNIIFILTDDQRWSALGYSGNPLATTPEMDKLAEAGAYFRNAIVTTPICSASRSSIFSGVHERTHKYTFQTGSIRSEFMENAYPELLHEAGYYNGFFGKFGVNAPGREEMFDKVEIYDRNGRFNDYRGYFYKNPRISVRRFQIMPDQCFH